jgi:hypothetical protein
VTTLAELPHRSGRYGYFPSLFDAEGGEPTLDEVLVGAWEGLAAHQRVECPVCLADRMEPEYGAHARPIGGRCSGCGSVLR